MPWGMGCDGVGWDVMGWVEGRKEGRTEEGRKEGTEEGRKEGRKEESKKGKLSAIRRVQYG